MWVILGLHTGLVFHTSLVALGGAALFKVSPLAFTVLKVVGALYLLYLAWQAFRSGISHLSNKVSGDYGFWYYYRRGVIMNITNPKVSIFFLAFLPQFASPEQGNLMLQLFMLGGIFIVFGFTMFCGFALMAGKLGNWLRRSPSAQIYLNRLAGVVFIGLAVKLLLTDAEAT